MSENENEGANSQFKGWAQVDQFGHTRLAGYVTSCYFGSACLFRIDTPELPERTYVLTEPTWSGGKWLPAGAEVQRPASAARTKLIGPSSIFAINPCDEEAARLAIDELYPRPLIVLKVPERPQLPEAPAEKTEIDPVCGAEVTDGLTANPKRRAEWEGKMYYFCSPDCREEFVTSPEDYVGNVPEPQF